MNQHRQRAIGQFIGTALVLTFMMIVGAFAAGAIICTLCAIVRLFHG